jgi:hypothetical protein
MTPCYLQGKIALLVLALLTVTWQCAAQCIAQPCQQDRMQVPPCHGQQPTKHDTTSTSCKASLLTAEEVRSHCSYEASASPATQIPFTLARFVGEYTLRAEVDGQAWRPPKLPLPFGPVVTSPLRL